MRKLDVRSDEEILNFWSSDGRLEAQIPRARAAAATDLLEALKAICRANEFTVAHRIAAENAIHKAEGTK